MPEGKLVIIRSQLNNLALGIAENDASPGEHVSVYPFQEGNKCQQWFEHPILGSIHSAENENFVLDLQDNTLVVNDYKAGDKSQRWRIAGEKIVNRDDGNLVLDIANINRNAGARLCSWAYNGGANQHWSFEYLAAQYFYIVSQLNEKVVDVVKADRSAGTPLGMWKKHKEVVDSQLFYEDKSLNIRSKLNDFVLRSSESEETVTLQPYEDGDKDGYWYRSGLKIVKNSNPSHCLDIRGSNCKKRADVIEFPYTGSTNQHWEFIYV